MSILGVVPWVLPAAVGIPAIAIWTWRDRQKFGDAPVRPRTRPA